MIFGLNIRLLLLWSVSHNQKWLLDGLCGLFTQCNSVLYWNLGTQQEGEKGLRCPEPSRSREMWPPREPLQFLLLFLDCQVPWIHKYDKKVQWKTFFSILKLASWFSESEWNSLAFPVFYIRGGPWLRLRCFFCAQYLSPDPDLYVSVLKGPKLVATATMLNLSRTPRPLPPPLRTLRNKTNIVP